MNPRKTFTNEETENSPHRLFLVKVRLNRKNSKLSFGQFPSYVSDYLGSK